ncbi:MAG: sensor histidine kinase [Eubacteriales bacterium]|nr:sensor histidine kinase [Eubacteriales bacterium]
MKILKKLLDKLYFGKSIQIVISLPFTVLSICSVLFLGTALYGQFADRTERLAVEHAGRLLSQTAINLEDYLRNMRRISDAMYYSVIKEKDLSADTLDEEMTLLYEANKDKLVSIACYDSQGSLITAAPIDTEKQQPEVTSQGWFLEAVREMENFHFSIPHVQNLFDDPSFRYYWVISLSRTVELTRNGVSSPGVLLVDMNYSSIEQLLDKANADNSGAYVYLCSRDGELIYHPMQNQIYMGLAGENNAAVAGYGDETIEESFEGRKRLVTAKTISYTGWKLVSVVPKETFSLGMAGMRELVILLVSLAILAVILLNQLVSAWIAMPLKKLNQSIQDWEGGQEDPNIYIGGSTEVVHLGRTLQSTLQEIRALMQDIVIEQEEKRKSELDALQSQINPHFLYNTLDSIVWMITGERYEDAVFMVKQLAGLFRISLSRGKTIISVEDELTHAKNYMNIQKIRYKNSFELEYEIDPEICHYCSVKLILQPILENALYYGVESMDGEGEILVKGWKDGEDIYLEVSDNGLGMQTEEAEKLLLEGERKRKHGSGVGLVNVHSRLKLRFGAEYGLQIISAPDEGMTVRIHMPAIPYNDENQNLLEKGRSQAVRNREREEKEEKDKNTAEHDGRGAVR